MNRRVVVTGMGLVTPLGIGREIFFQRLIQGETAIAPVKSFDAARFPSRLAAEVTSFAPGDFISARNARRMDRLSQITTAAAHQALKEAGIVVDSANQDRIGIIIGTAFGATDVAAGFAKTLFTEGPRFVSPLLAPNIVMNAPAGHAAIELGIRGVNTTVNHREASAETALAFAASSIKSGRADVILAGGADILSEFFFEMLTYFKALSPDDGGLEQARPFDFQRNGPVVGEGAGVLCLESLDHALARDAKPFCEILGWAATSAPAPPNDWPSDPLGPALAMEKAIRSAGLSPEDIDTVSASANGGRNLDRLEAEALIQVFGKYRTCPLISSIKGAVGESFSSGGIRAAALALSLYKGMIPPTTGLEQPLHNDLAFVMDKSKVGELRRGMVNGIASGGTFVSVVLGNFCLPRPAPIFDMQPATA